MSKLTDQQIQISILTGLEDARKAGQTPAFSYERISHEVQKDGSSLQNQRLSSREYAKRKNLQIVHQFEVIESASKGDRKVFKKMLELALQHGIKHLIFKNTDRMSRNYEEWIFLDKLIASHDITVHFHQSGKTIHKNSDFNDRFVINIELAVAKQLSDKSSQDQFEANKKRVNCGVAPFKNAPFGYTYDKKEKVFVKDPDTRNTAQMIFDLFDTGKYSLQQMIDYLEQQGIKSPYGRDKWTVSYLHKLLTNEFYHGEFYFRQEDKIMQGIHEPYYDKARFEERRMRLQKKHKGRKNRNFEFAFSGMLKCTCGKTMTGEQHTIKLASGVDKLLIYYSHRCPHKLSKRTGKYGGQLTIREPDFTCWLDEEMKRISFSKDFAEKLKWLFKVELADPRKNLANQKSVLSRNINKLETKKKRLINAFAEGLIDDHVTLNSQMKDYQKEIERLEKERRGLDNNFDDTVVKIAQVIDRLREMPRIVKDAPREGKAEILRSMIEYITVKENGELTIHWMKPFSLLMDAEVLGWQEEDRLETQANLEQTKATKQAEHKKSRNNAKMTATSSNKDKQNDENAEADLLRTFPPLWAEKDKVRTKVASIGMAFRGLDAA